MKVEAMRDDENVFDVAFEGMGTEEATASATDVKVWGATKRVLVHHWWLCADVQQPVLGSCSAACS